MIPYLVRLTDSESGQSFICNMNNVQSIGLSPSKNALVNGTAVVFNDRSFVFVMETEEQVIAYYNQTLFAILGGLYEFWSKRLLGKDQGSEQSDSGEGTSAVDAGAGPA